MIGDKTGRKVIDFNSDNTDPVPVELLFVLSLGEDYVVTCLIFLVF